MKTKRLFAGLNNSQKIRVIVDGVGIYTRIKNVPEMFSTYKHREAVEHCLNYLSEHRVQPEAKNYTGTATRVNDVNVQVDLL